MIATLRQAGSIPHLSLYGGVLKWLKRLVLKTRRRVKACVGSNPTLSVQKCNIYYINGIVKGELSMI